MQAWQNPRKYLNMESFSFDDYYQQRYLIQAERISDVTQVFIHPKSRDGVPFFDLAMAKLEFTGKGGPAKPVCLPFDYIDVIEKNDVEEKSYQECHILSMNSVLVGNVINSNRQFITPIEENKCNYLNPLSSFMIKRDDFDGYDLFCGQANYSMQGTCKGDSGAGLICWNSERNHWFVKGIVSRGSQCYENYGRLVSVDGISVFTGLDERWIVKVMNEN